MLPTLIPLADGFEEIEAVTVIDILRRAGAQVTTAGLVRRTVTGAHGIVLTADCLLEAALSTTWELVVLPGGEQGVEHLGADNRLAQVLKTTLAAGYTLGAICAAPALLDRLGLVSGQLVSVHPAAVRDLRTAIPSGARVQRSGRIITGRSAGTAMEFALTLVETLLGRETRDQVNQRVLAGV